MEDCQFTGNLTSGARFTRCPNVRVRNVHAHGNAEDGLVFCRSAADLAGVTGENSDVGVRILDGSKISYDSTAEVSVAGATGQVFLGARGVVSWNGGAPSQNDYAADGSTQNVELTRYTENRGLTCTSAPTPANRQEGDPSERWD